MKTIRKLCLLLALCLPLAGCALLASCRVQDGLNTLCADVGLNLADAQFRSDDDSHGGFHGDGVRLAVLHFDEAADAALLDTVEGWSPLPLSDELDDMLYKQIEGIYPSDVRIPRVEHGYWYFRDRYSAQSPDAEKPFTERYSYNFTAAVLDTDTNTLYYCEVDT